MRLEDEDEGGSVKVLFGGIQDDQQRPLSERSALSAMIFSLTDAPLDWVASASQAPVEVGGDHNSKISCAMTIYRSIDTSFVVSQDGPISRVLVSKRATMGACFQSSIDALSMYHINRAICALNVNDQRCGGAGGESPNFGCSRNGTRADA